MNRWKARERSGGSLPLPKFIDGLEAFHAGTRASSKEGYQYKLQMELRHWHGPYIFVVPEHLGMEVSTYDLIYNSSTVVRPIHVNFSERLVISVTIIAYYHTSGMVETLAMY
jgi:hypothetical protein